MQQQILKSWKDIAAYLKVAVSTVQRWERDLELPVRRAGGKRGSAIMALPSEIDDWLKTHLFMQGREPALTNSRPAPRDDSRKLQEEVIITESLWSRPSRPPDLSREIEAFRVLGREMLTRDPPSVLNSLIRHAINLCKAESAGISLLEKRRAVNKYSVGSQQPVPLGPMSVVRLRGISALPAFAWSETVLNFSRIRSGTTPTSTAYCRWQNFF